MLFRFDTFDQFEAPARRRPMLAMDATRTDDAVHIYLDAPGVTGDDIDLTVEQNSVTVEANRRWYDTDMQTILSERQQGTFKREIHLGDQLDTDGIEAELMHGVLTLTIPVKEGTKRRSIAVRSGDEDEARQLESSSN